MTKSHESVSPIQVLAVKSNDENRQSIVSSILTRIPGLELASEADNASEALQLLKVRRVDIALIDFGNSDTNGIELTRQIRESHPTVRVLIITASDAPEDIFATLDAGADGYVLQENLSRVLETALRSVRLGAVWLDPGIAKYILQAAQAPIVRTSRVLPTGLMVLPLFQDENLLLNEVAASNCTDGVCMVDPSFIRKLKRFAPA